LGEIKEIEIPSVKIWTVPDITPPKIIGSPKVPLPYIYSPCAEVRRDYTTSKKIFTDDPEGNSILCPGIPWFDPIQYNPKKIQIIETQQPNIQPPPTNTAATPTAEVPPVDVSSDEETPCPDPTKNNPRIGDIAASGKEKVSGFELRDGNCVVLYSDISAVEKYLPQVSTVSTTSVIASTAVISSVLAKPLADLILKIVKPTIKKLITTLKAKLLKKSPEKLSRLQRRMIQKDLNRAHRKMKKGW